MGNEHDIRAENDSLKRNMIKYGAHTRVCIGEKCICGFDEVKEQALEIIIEDQRRQWKIK